MLSLMPVKIKPLPFGPQYLHKYFIYDDGILYWRLQSRSHNAGDVAGGTSNKNPYCRIKIGQRTYKRSRLVWMMHTGEDSYPLCLDHIDRDKTNDRIENLRPATLSVNNSNRAWGASKHRYVYFQKGKVRPRIAASGNLCMCRDRECWRARVGLKNGKRKSLGNFPTEQEAINAVREWEASQCPSL